ncbi:transposase [Lachnospiraceae bacterium]|nr:transposase [Lachnospiraceae bacterium]
MRVTTSKSKNSESFYITKGYINDEGISTSTVIRKLGTLKELLIEHGPTRDDVMAWAKEEAKFETLKYKEEQKNKTVQITLRADRFLNYGKQPFFRGGYLFLQSIYYRLRLNKTCLHLKTKYRLKYDINAILSALIYARLLEPVSKRSSLKTASGFLESISCNSHDISHALDILGSECSFIQSQAGENSRDVCRHNDKTVYYDCSHYYFETGTAEACKTCETYEDNAPGAMIQMGLFFDGNGMPLAFSLLFENADNYGALPPPISETRDEFNYRKFIYCGDEEPQNHSIFNHIADRSYILTKPLQKLPATDKAWALDRNGFRRVSDNKPVDIAKLPDTDKNVYYKDKSDTDQKFTQRFIVAYSPKYALYQKTVRHELNIHNYDAKKLAEEAKYDGFYVVCTDLLKEHAGNILKVSERRWQTAEFFRIMKSDFSVNPLFLKDENRIRAHFLTCFLALLSYRVLESKLDRKYSRDEILETLNAINFAKIGEQGFIPLYKRNKITDALHDICGFRTDYQFITKSQMKNIQKKSKGRE